MKVELFDYNLPRNLIANEPVFPRDSAKMLVVGNCLLDSSVKDLTKFLLPGDIMVFNNTQVIPGRLRGLRDSVSVEVTLIKQIRGNVWRVLARPARRLNPGQVIKFNNDLSAEVIKKYDSDIELSFNLSGKKLLNALDQTGEMPLPPYINQPKNSDFINRKNYQTIYAAIPGAVAAPTAGLHFTEQLFNTIDDYKIKRVFTTLHVGPGTFQPIKVNDTDHHKMHSEVFNIDNETVIEIKNAKARGGELLQWGPRL